MKKILSQLNAAPVRLYLSSYSALDRFFRTRNENHHLKAVTNAQLVDIAKAFSTVEYPGMEDADAAVSLEGSDNGTAKKTVLLLKCVDEPLSFSPLPYSVQNLLYDVREDKYYDPFGVYEDIRKNGLVASRRGEPPCDQWTLVTEAAILMSRFHYEAPGASIRAGHIPDEQVTGLPLTTLDKQEQRYLLSAILTGANPERGLELLAAEGFLEKHWPELLTMRTIHHSKEYHPEGDVWQHTMETFRYRKIPDLTLSLSLLLHDIGKAYAERNGSRQFHRHAQIGASIAEKFLRKLGFADDLIGRVRFLVENHMLPSYIPTLSARRIDEVMSSPHFPLVLEIFRCDIASTFRGPTMYYKACKAYRKFLKNKRNPFRSADGKKLVRLYVE
jgi:poly(A) polymerase